MTLKSADKPGAEAISTGSKLDGHSLLDKWRGSLPYSVIQVYQVIRELGVASTGEIVAATRLAPRTVRNGLTCLDRLGLLQRTSNLSDLRRSLYSLKD